MRGPGEGRGARRERREFMLQGAARAGGAAVQQAALPVQLVAALMYAYKLQCVVSLCLCRELFACGAAHTNGSVVQRRELCTLAYLRRRGLRTTGPWWCAGQPQHALCRIQPGLSVTQAPKHWDRRASHVARIRKS